MKNEKFERTVKYIVVVAFSVIATGSIILGAAKYQNDTNEETESEKAIKDTVLKETQMDDNTLSSDKEETKEETKESETINDDGLNDELKFTCKSGYDKNGTFVTDSEKIKVIHEDEYKKLL